MLNIESTITFAGNLPKEYVAGYILAKIQALEIFIYSAYRKESPNYEWIDSLKDAKDKLYLYANSIGLDTMEFQQIIEVTENKSHQP